MSQTPLAVDLPCACTALRKAARAVSRLYDAALAPTGLTTPQLAILRAIDRAGEDGAPLRQLAAGLVMDASSLYRGLGPLIRSGWVEVRPASKGRTKIARLTARGQEATAAAAAPWEGAQSNLVDAFGPLRWAALQREIAALAEVGLRLNP